MSKLWLKLPLLLVVIAIICGLFAYRLIGKTPGELLDYVDIRLQGHPKLEMLSAPVIKSIREYTNQPALAARLQQPFVIPSPPPLVVDKNLLANLPAAAPGVIRVGPGQQFLQIADAARHAKDGQVVEILAGNYYGDVALWQQKSLTIKAIGGRARLFADGKSAEDKAIWVFRNGNFIVENIEFLHAKVSDQNGAGIRAEAGSLSVRNCLFFGNQNGILSGDQLTLVEIERSEFAYNGAGDGLSHGIYIGPIAEFRAYGNYFHHANRGHLIKSRAEKSIIAYNRITDETGGRASYEIDLPNAGNAIVAFNLIQQSATGENSALINFGAEGLRWQRNELWLEKNTLVNDNPWGGTFWRVAKNVSKFISLNNLIAGPGGFQSNATHTVNNDIAAEWDWFVLPQRLNYQLKSFIPANAFDYIRPELSPAPGFYQDIANYQLDPAAIKFAGAMPVQGASQ